MHSYSLVGWSNPDHDDFEHIYLQKMPLDNLPRDSVSNEHADSTSDETGRKRARHAMDW